jgi:hypothetical protein
MRGRSRAGGEGGGEAEVELPRVGGGGQAGLERQPQHADRHFGPHQRPVFVPELDGHLHGFDG